MLLSGYIDRHGLSDKVHCEIQSKKTMKGIAVLAIHLAINDILSVVHYSKDGALEFKL